MLLDPSPARAADVKLRGIAVDQSLEAPVQLDVRQTLPPIVRVTLDDAAFRTADRTLARLREVVDQHADRHMPLIVAFGATPSADADVEAWREFLRAAAERSRGKVAGYQIGSVRADQMPDVGRYAYLLKLAAVQLHAVDDSAPVLQGSLPLTALPFEREVLASGLSAYVDGVAIGGRATEDGDAFRADVRQMSDLVQREKPTATIVVGPIHLPPTADAAKRVMIDAALRSVGAGTQVTAFDGEPAVIRAALAGAANVTELIARDLVTLDERPSGVKITRAGTDVTASVSHYLLYSTSALETYFVYWSVASATPLDVEIAVRDAPTPKILDPLTGAVQNPTRVERTPQSDRLVLGLPAADHPLIVDFNFGNASGLSTSVDVRNDLLPRVEEIIARHQQAQAAQDAALHNYIAHVRIEQHFHPSPADPAYNIVTENRLFFDRAGTEWEELSFELNGAKWGTNRPPFPLVQPEKVLSLPLDLRLNQDYVYRLTGVEAVNGRPAYVVRFDPADAAHALYRGIVWVDRATFLRLKVQAVETKLAGPVVSNDETQFFSQAGEQGGRSIWLVDRLVSKQVFLIAGRSVLIEREVHLGDFVLNTPDFEPARQSARGSNRVMYRDTDQGVRYLVKEGENRVVSNQLTTSAKAFALGADIDPSFDYPLPIGGVDIIDFNFLKRNLQLALLYGGVIAIGNVQRANLWGGKFDASVDFFGLALKANDDVFDADGRRSGQRVNRIPAAVGVNVGYQLTPFQKVSGHHELKYDAYFRDATTDSTFVIPSSTATNGEGVGYEYRRRGYSLLANAAAYRRSTWNPWGAGSTSGTFDGRTSTYTKYDAGLSKDFIFRTFHTIHLNGTYFGGERLDRFSMYQFGMFDATRMHGVPSAVRFSDLAMFRGSYSFNLFDIYRLDLFVDHARGRDAQTSSSWLPVTGTGIRVNLRAPHDTILQVDYGKSFLPGVYRGAGSNVLQILLLKPL